MWSQQVTAPNVHRSWLSTELGPSSWANEDKTPESAVYLHIFWALLRSGNGGNLHPLQLSNLLSLSRFPLGTLRSSLPALCRPFAICCAASAFLFRFPASNSLTSVR